MREICACDCTSGHRTSRLSRLQAFSPKSKTTLATRRTFSRTGQLSSPDARGTRGRNAWARERVKAHTKRCREQITRQNLRHFTRSRDTTATDDSSDARLACEEMSVADKLPIVALSVDTTLVGSSSTPKSSPASFCDVSVMPCFSF